MTTPPVHLVIIGLGNPILSDDGVGWRVAQQVRELLARPDHKALAAAVEIVQACVGGLSLAEHLVGFRRAVIIDAIMTGGTVPGTVYSLGLRDLPGTLNTASAHDTNLVTALQALRRFEAEVPADDAIHIVAVEAHDVWTFSEQCTPEVEASIPAAVQTVLQVLAGEIAD